VCCEHECAHARLEGQNFRMRAAAAAKWRSAGGRGPPASPGLARALLLSSQAGGLT
jgi:hypothetical protein